MLIFCLIVLLTMTASVDVLEYLHRRLRATAAALWDSCSSCKLLQNSPIKSRAENWSGSFCGIAVQSLSLAKPGFTAEDTNRERQCAAVPQHETNAFVLTQEELKCIVSLQNGGPRTGLICGRFRTVTYLARTLEQ